VAQRQYCYNLPELDSTKRYDLFINVRDNNDYQFNNLFLIVALELQMDLQSRYT
jgi:hypothetical protein